MKGLLLFCFALNENAQGSEKKTMGFQSYQTSLVVSLYDRSPCWDKGLYFLAPAYSYNTSLY